MHYFYYISFLNIQETVLLAIGTATLAKVLSEVSLGNTGDLVNPLLAASSLIVLILCLLISLSCWVQQK
jgi:hypothetical protein